MTKPFTRSWLGSPLALTNCARPTVPPAPGTFVTCTFLALPEVVRACCMERAVWSQPPPGAAGAMILSSIWAVAPVARPAVIAPARSARARALGKNDIGCSSVGRPGAPRRRAALEMNGSEARRGRQGRGSFIQRGACRKRRARIHDRSRDTIDSGGQPLRRLALDRRALRPRLGAGRHGGREPREHACADHRGGPHGGRDPGGRAAPPMARRGRGRSDEPARSCDPGLSRLRRAVDHVERRAASVPRDARRVRRGARRSLHRRPCAAAAHAATPAPDARGVLGAGLRRHPAAIVDRLGHPSRRCAARRRLYLQPPDVDGAGADDSARLDAAQGRPPAHGMARAGGGRRDDRDLVERGGRARRPGRARRLRAGALLWPPRRRRVRRLPRVGHRPGAGNGRHRRTRAAVLRA